MCVLVRLICSKRKKICDSSVQIEGLDICYSQLYVCYVHRSIAIYLVQNMSLIFTVDEYKINYV